MSNWKYTIPVARAEDRLDGAYIIGEASGPEPDSHGTEMAREAIEDFARQIKERVEQGDPLPYIDSHQKDGVLRTLGHVMEAAVTPDFHLMVAVRLDTDNPAATFLYSSLKRGKQYGMSIAGDGVEYVRAKTAGGPVLRFMKVVLREISNTTRPSWVPSFGTVLARSIDNLGESEVSEELVRDESAPEVETVAEESEVAADVEKSSDEQTIDAADEAAPEEPEAPVERTTDEPIEADEDVERARIAKRDVSAILEAMKALATKLETIGIAEADEATPETPETPVENSEKGEEETVEFGGIRVERAVAEALTAYVDEKINAAVEPLKAEIERKDAYIEELLALPAGKVPAPVVRDKFDNDLDRIAGLTPEERLRIGLSAVYADR